MIDSAFICKVLNPQVVQRPVQDRNGHWFVKLKETDPSAKLRTVDLYGVSADAVVVKLDAGKPPSDLLDKSGGQRRRCDYLVATEHKGRRILVYIDLKSGHVDNDIKRQFKGGVCLVRYVDAVMEQFHNRPGFFAGFDESRFVVFYEPLRLQKNPSRTRKATGNTVIERFYKYPNPSRPWIENLVGQ